MKTLVTFFLSLATLLSVVRADYDDYRDNRRGGRVLAPHAMSQAESEAETRRQHSAARAKSSHQCSSGRRRECTTSLTVPGAWR